MCQKYWRDDDAYEAERACQQQHLFLALQKPDEISPTYEAAFADRCQESATLAARAVLEHLAGSDGATTAHTHRQQALEEVLGPAQDKARTHILALQQDLATLLYLDRSSHEEEIRGWRERLEQILDALGANTLGAPHLPMQDNIRAADVPPDFPELDVLLDQIGRIRNEWRARIQAGQIEELEKLRQQPKYADAAAKLLNSAANIDPVTLDDMIATVTDGYDPLTPVDSGTDNFTTFFPGFVEEVTRERPDFGAIMELAEHREARGPFDFTNRDDSAVERTAGLLDSWKQARVALKGKNRGLLEQGINRLLGQIGFTGVQASQDRVLVPQRLHVFKVRCDRLSTQNWFLPPDFGSSAQGNYRVLVASEDVQPSNLAAAIGEAPDTPWIILHFTRMSSNTRRDLARIMRKDKRIALLLDETLLLYLATVPGDSLEQFFACSAPFAWLQPYTTNPRNIPPEMFFGRREEMDQILSRQASGTLIYGGRQLGKSALLNHIRHNHHRPEQGRIALYLDIQDIGEAPVAAEEIWTRLYRDLPPKGGPAPAGGTREQIREAILAWLQSDQDRRFLVMFDEADHFLAAEHPAYPNLRVMKDMMESTGWRFKAVFAGLHNVRRLSQAPNSPLAHLGTPICVGPMNGQPETRRALRRLVEQPMRAAGYTYYPPGLAEDIAARVNHYPSLVQVFCKEVLVAAGGQGAELGAGPRWMLQRERLFEGRLANRIAQEIRQRFQITLDLDLRYDLVAKCLALYRLDREDGHTSVLRSGLAAGKIHDLVRDWWPPGIAPASGEDFKALLDEMVDLGVLGKREGQDYGLRNAQVAQMLGTRETVESELLALAEKEPKVDYDAGTYHRPSDPNRPDSLSPLPDRQLQALFSVGTGLKILFAPAGLWGEDVAERLRRLACSWSEEAKSTPAWDGEVDLFEGSTDDLPGYLDRRKKLGLIVITSPWKSSFVAPLQARIVERRNRLRLIWLVEGNAVLEAQQAGVEVFFAPMLGDTMLRRWLARHGLAGLDDRTTRGAILRASGGALQRLRGMRNLLAELRADVLERREQLLEEWARKTPLKPQQAGVEGACLGRLADLAVLLDQPTDIKDVEDMFPAELPTFITMGLVEALPNGQVQLSALGALLAN
ncbi:ATP-binding protein [Acidocella facilis]|uniref:hypothetical protein n=1 Tax=Acidocella facilis TaxID=525 RepID=UPI001F2ECD87|nr:hypothetical protein [Acidocella facilis]